MKNTIKNEKGFVLITSMMMLVVLMIIGIAATNTTMTELQISGNQKTSEMAFYGADGGGYVAIKATSRALDQSESPEVNNVEYLDDDYTNTVSETNFYTENGIQVPNPQFYEELVGFNDDSGRNDLAFSISENVSATADVQLLRVVNMAGGGAEFAASYAGVGATGPKGAYYGIRTRSEAPNASSAQIYIQYMKALGVAGGL